MENLRRERQLGWVTMRFTVAEADEVDGLVCARCGQPIETEQEVTGESALTHVMCPTESPGDARDINITGG